MSCDEILEWVGEEVLKEYRNLHHTRGLRPGDRDVNYVGEGPGGEAAMDPAGAGGDETLVDDDDDDEPARSGRLCLPGQQPQRGEQTGKLEAPAAGLEEAGEEGPSPHWATLRCPLGEFIRAHPQGCFVCYGRKKGFNHDH